MSILDSNTADPLQQYADRRGELDELYEVVRTVIVGGHNWKYYRLEVVKRILEPSEHRPAHYFTVFAYVEDVLDVQRTAGPEQAVAGRTRIWTRWTGFPPIRADDADRALEEGLRHLTERVRG